MLIFFNSYWINVHCGPLFLNMGCNSQWLFEIKGRMGTKEWNVCNVWSFRYANTPNKRDNSQNIRWDINYIRSMSLTLMLLSLLSVIRWLRWWKTWYVYVCVCLCPMRVTLFTPSSSQVGDESWDTSWAECPRGLAHTQIT